MCSSRGVDLNGWLVAQGHAVAYRRYSTDYIDAEAEARTAKRSVWQREFDLPWAWRQGKRGDNTQSASSTTSSTACRIKGNISRSGVKTFHAPGMRHYQITRIDTSKGERWFCSEAEAAAAGWMESCSWVSCLAVGGTLPLQNPLRASVINEEPSVPPTKPRRRHAYQKGSQGFLGMSHRGEGV